MTRLLSTLPPLRRRAAGPPAIAVAGATIFIGGLAGIGAFAAVLAEPIVPFHSVLGPGAWARIGGATLCILALAALPSAPTGIVARPALAGF